METLGMTVATHMVLLALSVILLLFHVMLQGMLATKELGSAWNAGPRDQDMQPKGALAGRAARASANYRETYPAFIGLILGAALSGDVAGWGLIGGWIWFAARIAYIPLYLTGIPYIRSLIWVASIAGLLLMTISLF